MYRRIGAIRFSKPNGMRPDILKCDRKRAAGQRTVSFFSAGGSGATSRHALLQASHETRLQAAGESPMKDRVLQTNSLQRTG